MLLGAGSLGNRLVPLAKSLGLLNRLNEGNPNYTPYEVK
jgi:hypothetical protein